VAPDDLKPYTLGNPTLIWIEYQVAPATVATVSALPSGHGIRRHRARTSPSTRPRAATASFQPIRVGGSMMMDVGLAHAWNTGVSTYPAGQWYVGIVMATALWRTATEKPSPHVHPDDPSGSSNLRDVRQRTPDPTTTSNAPSITAKPPTPTVWAQIEVPRGPPSGHVSSYQADHTNVTPTTDQHAPVVIPAALPRTEIGSRSSRRANRSRSTDRLSRRGRGPA